MLRVKKERELVSENKDQPLYVIQAVNDFKELMATNHKDVMDKINRTNKGEFFVLHYLVMREPEPVIPSDLSAALQSSSARISSLLNTLEKKGQIKREVDETNRRNILVTITQEGRVRIQEELDILDGYMESIFIDMGQSDTWEFMRLMRKFSDLSYKYFPKEIDDL